MPELDDEAVMGLQQVLRACQLKCVSSHKSSIIIGSERTNEGTNQ